MKRNTKKIVLTAASVIGILFALAIGMFLFMGRHLTSTNLWIQSNDRASNKPFTFYAKVVDQDGAPLPGAEITMTVFRFNENWAWSGKSANRGANYEALIRSDSEGNAVLSGYGESIYYIKVRHPGYQWLFDKDLGGDDRSPMASLTSYLFTPHGHPDYLPDPNKPAVFVMIKDGEHIARIAPSPGGSLSPRHIAGQRIKLDPVWPRDPSIKDIVYEKNWRETPSTQPATFDWDLSRDNRCTRLNLRSYPCDWYLHFNGPGTIRLRVRGDSDAIHSVAFDEALVSTNGERINNVRIMLAPGTVGEAATDAVNLCFDWKIRETFSIDEFGRFGEDVFNRSKIGYLYASQSDFIQHRSVEIRRSFTAGKPYQAVLVIGLIPNYDNGPTTMP